MSIKTGITGMDLFGRDSHKSPIMYSGELTHFELLIRASMINTMVDVFGKNIKPETISIQDQKKFGLKDPSSEWLRMRITSSMDGMILSAITVHSQSNILYRKSPLCSELIL